MKKSSGLMETKRFMIGHLVVFSAQARIAYDCEGVRCRVKSGYFIPFLDGIFISGTIY